MSRLITLEGPGGSGKTTLGYSLQNSLPKSVCYDLDDYIDPIYDSSQHLSEKDRMKRIERSLMDGLKTFRSDLKEGKDVIVPYWSFSAAKEVQGLVREIDNLDREGNFRVIRFMLESPLERCIQGDASRDKYLGAGHITNVWGQVYQGIDSRHILVPNHDYMAQKRVEDHLRYLH